MFWFPYGYFWRQNYGDTDWFRFLLWPCILVALISLSYGQFDFRKAVPYAVVQHAPFDELDRVMEETKSDGYLLYQNGRYLQDPDNPQRILIEYSLENSDHNEKNVYSWAWEVPKTLLNERDEEDILAKLDQCILIPLNENAESVQEKVMVLIENGEP